MHNQLVEIAVKGLMPARNGIAVFLGTESRTFVIHVDPAIGKAMHKAIRGAKNDRPLTHDLITNIFVGFGIEVERVVINGRDEDAFYARLVMRMANEVDTKIVEIDARPSDCIVLALQARRPIYVTRAVFDKVDDVTELLERMRDQGEADAQE
jgi:uncharacterized protein